MGILYCMELESPPTPTPRHAYGSTNVSWQIGNVRKILKRRGGRGGGRASNSAIDWQQPTGFQIFFFPQQWAEKRQTAFGDEVGG